MTLRSDFPKKARVIERASAPEDRVVRYMILLLTFVVSAGSVIFVAALFAPRVPTFAVVTDDASITRALQSQHALRGLVVRVESEDNLKRALSIQAYGYVAINGFGFTEDMDLAAIFSQITARRLAFDDCAGLNLNALLTIVETLPTATELDIGCCDDVASSVERAHLHYIARKNEVVIIYGPDCQNRTYLLPRPRQPEGNDGD